MKPELIAFAFMSPLVVLIIYVGVLKMTNQEIKDRAPDGATHYDLIGNVYKFDNWFLRVPIIKNIACFILGIKPL